MSERKCEQVITRDATKGKEKCGRDADLSAIVMSAGGNTDGKRVYLCEADAQRLDALNRLVTGSARRVRL